MQQIISKAQWQCLADMPANRPLILQFHWRWGEAEPADISAVVAELQKHQLISRSKVDLLAIGDSGNAWSELWLVEYSNPAQAKAHLDAPQMQGLLAEARNAEILVATLPHPRVQRFLRVLSHLLGWLPQPRRGADMPDAELTGGINPTRQQMQAFSEAAQDSPTHMYNLLRFHDRAQYVDGDRGHNGQQAYETGYGRVALSCILRLGGRIVALGRYRFTLLGNNGEPGPDAWDEIAVLEYPNRQAFTHMLSNPTYLKALEHRHAGLQTTQVWSTSPLLAG
ncbi:MAG: hypothetical protein R3352_05470 [Salinisphaeraceae bacterium]|nr:hypothetical protein [Salinisphaeraceae bacterium]